MRKASTKQSKRRIGGETEQTDYSTKALDAWANKAKEKEPKRSDLALVSKLARRQLALAIKMAKIAEQLQGTTNDYNSIRLKELPEALAQCGVEMVILKTGEKVEIKTDYYCSLTGKHREPAIAWLRKKGFDDLISRNVVASFGKGQDKEADRALKAMDKFKHAVVKAVEEVNTGSFKALVREQIEAGVPVPVAQLGITVQEAAKISPPKKRTVI